MDPPIRYGTYVLFLRGTGEDQVLAVAFKRVHSAFRLWVAFDDGRLELLGQAGRVAAVPADAIPAMRRTVGSFRSAGARAVILEVADFWTSRGGPWEPPLIGAEHAVRTESARRRSWDYWAMGFIFVMGLYHLTLFSLRRSLHSALYLGISCFALVIYAYSWGDFYQTDRPDAIVFELIWKLRHGCYPILGLTLVYYAFSILRRPFWRRLRLVVLGWNAAMVPLILLASPLQITHFQILIDFGIVLCIAYGIPLTYFFLWASRGDERGEAIVVILSANLLAVCGVNDILMTYAAHPGPRVYHYAATVWMLGQAYLVAARFARARSAAERVSEELQKVNGLKDQFLANTSHELRTPLHGIIGIIDSLLAGVAGPLNSSLRSNLQFVASGGRRLVGLVNDILDFSKLNQGDVVLRRQPLDLWPVVRIVAEVTRPLIADERVVLSVSESKLPLVYADEDRLQQILFNLLGNAIKFTKEGSITVSARELTSESQSASAFVEVSIADTGVGISGDKHEVIFEHFAQADGSVSREYGGTGLGLPVTRQLVELHGGTVAVESRVGAGATFRFTLPIADPADPTAGRATAEPERLLPAWQRHLAADSPQAEAGATGADLVAAESPAPRSPGIFRALAVDDDPINLQVLRNHLSLQGFEMTEARSGAEALALVSQGAEFDIVLLDVMMPQLSGFEVCRELRKSFSQSELPIILLTAKNRISDLISGLNNGANDYLTKPFDHQELLARVRTLVELKAAAQQQSFFAALKSELELARSIQMSLLPDHVPDVVGLRVAARYRAMESVGGDFYTFSGTGQDLGVLVTDVSGHGVPAALIVSMVHLAFSVHASNPSDPAQMLGSLNRILYGNIGAEFITGCYAHFDPVGRRLVTSNAGHPPVLVWKERLGEIVALRPRGRIFGLMPEVEFEVAATDLESGDRILLYTDGAIEASTSSGKLFGEEGLHRVLREQSSLEADQFAEHLIELLESWCGAADAIDDDIALVVVDVL